MKKPSKKKLSKPRNAVFVYISACCNERAEKAPLTMPDDNRIGRLGAIPKDADEQGLHGWRCTKCKKPAKVSRHKPQKEAGAVVLAVAA